MRSYLYFTQVGVGLAVIVSSGLNRSLTVSAGNMFQHLTQCINVGFGYGNGAVNAEHVQLAAG